MPIVYTVKTSVVNESLSKIERLAVKVTQIANTTISFIKTCPFTDYRNRSILHLIKNELPPHKRTAYLGISFTSYKNINMIEFYSTFKDFALKKNDEIELHFCDETVMKFVFSGGNTSYGPAKRNVHLITDDQLEFFANTKLLYWKLINAEKNMVMTGGFSYQEDNKQYKSEKIGRQLFKTMAKEILSTKLALI